MALSDFEVTLSKVKVTIAKIQHFGKFWFLDVLLNVLHVKLLCSPLSSLSIKCPFRMKKSPIDNWVRRSKFKGHRPMCI